MSTHRDRAPRRLPRPLDAGGRRGGAAGAVAERRRRRGARRARPERLGQVDAAAPARRARAAVGRRGARVRRGAREAAVARARALPLDDARLRRPALRARARAGALARDGSSRSSSACAARPATSACAAPTSCSSVSGSPRSATAARRELSGGEQQRVALCAALAHRPRVFLADEPTGELDAATADQVYDVLGELVREHGCTTVIVSHDPESARIADRIVRIRDGRVSEEWSRARRRDATRSSSAAAAGCACRRSCCCAPGSARRRRRASTTAPCVVDRRATRASPNGCQTPPRCLTPLRGARGARGDAG